MKELKTTYAIGKCLHENKFSQNSYVNHVMLLCSFDRILKNLQERYEVHCFVVTWCPGQRFICVVGDWSLFLTFGEMSRFFLRMPRYTRAYESEDRIAQHLGWRSSF